MEKLKINYPFTAIVGQEKMKKALVLNVINPFLGGVLIRGEKGTAKSTAVRALAELLPEREQVKGCVSGCDPLEVSLMCSSCMEKKNKNEGFEVVLSKMRVIDLPVSATEDRVVGTLDIEHAIRKGEKRFEPGILAQANRNILYVDEVNLLDDHVVDVLLDSAAMGINTVEREGISYTHPARFILVGTMNPEEGDLRPQLLDRFGLVVNVTSEKNPVRRIEVIKRRLEFENDPASFSLKFENQQQELRERISKAKLMLNQVSYSDKILEIAAKISIAVGVDGHRADVSMIKTAMTIAALNLRENVTEGDMVEAAEYVLPHRMRRKPFEESAIEFSEIEKIIYDEQAFESETDHRKDEFLNDKFDGAEQKDTVEERQTEGETANRKDGSLNREIEGNPETEQNANDSPFVNDEENIEEPGKIFDIKPLDIQVSGRKKRKGSGRRSRTSTDALQGRYIRYAFPKGKIRDIAFDATLRAAAPYQSFRKRNETAVSIKNADLREKVREKQVGSTILFIVDASGSMGVRQRMKAVKGAILSLLNDAYQKRDKVGMIAFRKNSAQLLLGITRSVDLARKSLKDLPTGGKTPLASGLYSGYEVIKAAKIKDPDMVPLIVLVSDGRANVSLNGRNPFDEAISIANIIAAEGIKSLVLDTEKDFIKLGLASKIADAMGAEYFKLEESEEKEIELAVRNLVYR